MNEFENERKLQLHQLQRSIETKIYVKRIRILIYY